MALGPHQGHVSAVCAGENVDATLVLNGFEVSRFIDFMLEICDTK